MNMYTLYDVRNYLAKYVGGGLSVDDARVIERINEIDERLSIKENWHGTICTITMCVHNGYITLPREIMKIMKSRINGEVSHVWSQWYEFLQNGPGLLEDTSFTNFDMIDRGFAPTQYDIPQGPDAYQLLVIAEDELDVNKEVFIQGWDENGKDVSETVKLDPRNPYYTETYFQKIKSVLKARTVGYVYLSTWDNDTKVRFHLAAYHPDETNPNYRRFALGEMACEEANRQGLQELSYRLDAVVKRCHVPLIHDTDIPIIQNLAAFKMMSRAIDYEDQSDTDTADKWEAKAERMLDEQLSDVQTDEIELEVQLDGFASGVVPTV